MAFNWVDILNNEKASSVRDKINALGGGVETLSGDTDNYISTYSSNALFLSMLLNTISVNDAMLGMNNTAVNMGLGNALNQYYNVSSHVYSEKSLDYLKKRLPLTYNTQTIADFIENSSVYSLASAKGGITTSVEIDNDIINKNKKIVICLQFQAVSSIDIPITFNNITKIYTTSPADSTFSFIYIDIDDFNITSANVGNFIVLAFTISTVYSNVMVIKNDINGAISQALFEVIDPPTTALTVSNIPNANAFVLDWLWNHTTYGRLLLNNLIPQATSYNYIVAGEFTLNNSPDTALAVGTTNYNIRVPYSGYYNILFPTLANTTNSDLEIIGYVTIQNGDNTQQLPFQITVRGGNRSAEVLLSKVWLYKNTTITSLVITQAPQSSSTITYRASGLLLTAQAPRLDVSQMHNSVSSGTIPYWAGFWVNNKTDEQTIFTAPVDGTYTLNMQASGMSSSSSNPRYFRVYKRLKGASSNVTPELVTFGRENPLVYAKTITVQLNKGDMLRLKQYGFDGNDREFWLCVSTNTQLNDFNQ